MIELLLNQRRVHSVFNLIGEDENDITFSLGWALSSSPTFLRQFLRNLLGLSTACSEEPTITLQHFTQDAGITDIEIRSVNYHIIIEAKRGWELPSQDQLRKYLPRFKKFKAPIKLIVTMSECSQDYAKHKAIKLKRMNVRHLSWKDMSSLSNFNGGSQAEKRLMQEFRNYIATIVNMQPKESNWVYVLSLSDHEWAPGLTYIQTVEKRKRYFHPYAINGWPKDPPNYIGFRYGGKLQSIHYVKKAQIIKNFYPHFPEAPDAKIIPTFLYELGPAIRPARVVKSGKVIRSMRVKAMLDLLLTSKTISQARDASYKRAEKI